MIKKTIAITLYTFVLMQGCLADTKSDIINDYYGDNAAYYYVSFSDIDEPAWATESITFLAEFGIVSGNDGMFFPSDNITRDQFIKIIILGFGLYDKTATCSFTDVSKDSWQYPYIASAKKLGITSGINNTQFGVGELITRQQMVTLAYNAAKYAKIVFEVIHDKPFVDEGEVDGYAKEAITAFKQSGVITGDNNNAFRPQNYATRAEACKIIYSIIKNNT